MNRAAAALAGRVKEADGWIRKGKVFSIRIADNEREILERAARLKELLRWGHQPRSIGELVRACALVVARRVLCMPLAKEHAYDNPLDVLVNRELVKSLRERPATSTSTTAVPKVTGGPSAEHLRLMVSELGERCAELEAAARTVLDVLEDVDAEDFWVESARDCLRGVVEPSPPAKRKRAGGRR